MKKVNKRKRAKSIAKYDFSTLYTKIPHNDLIKKLSEIISFVFAGGDKNTSSLLKRVMHIGGTRLVSILAFHKMGL